MGKTITITTTKTVRFYTGEEVSAIYGKLKCTEKIKVLYDAIDYMSQYNGRTRFLCIAMAMGFRNDEGDNKSYYKPSDKGE